MTLNDISDKADQISENGLFKLIGRLSMASAIPVIVLAIQWNGSTLWAMQEKQSELAGKIAILQSTIEDRLRDSYKGADALRDLKIRDQKDIEQDRRFDEVRGELRAHEDRIRSLEAKR